MQLLWYYPLARFQHAFPSSAAPAAAFYACASPQLVAAILDKQCWFDTLMQALAHKLFFTAVLLLCYGFYLRVGCWVHVEVVLLVCDAANSIDKSAPSATVYCALVHSSISVSNQQTTVIPAVAQLQR